MKKKDYIAAIIKKAEEIKDKAKYCEPDCKNCLIAEARTEVDRENEITIPFANFVRGMYGDMSYKYDRWMMEALERVKTTQSSK